MHLATWTRLAIVAEASGLRRSPFSEIALRQRSASAAVISATGVRGRSTSIRLSVVCL
jgi:hypothetical protein